MDTSIEILDNVDRESMRSYNYIGETNVPDATSGTSDFDEKDADPEDCFCESGDVARKGDVTKVNNIGFDTLYHGDTTDLPMTLNVTKPFFLTPSIGMASIFCGRPTDEDLHKLKVQYKVVSPKTNRQYKEWNDPKTLASKEPLKSITVIIEGAPEIDKPIHMTKSGFIYVLKLTPEYKDLLHKSSAMGPNEYFIPAGNEIKFSEKLPVTLDVTIIGRPRPQSWGPNPIKYNVKGVIPVNESYVELSEFDHFFVEGYSKKQEHRVEKFLKENKFEEDHSKTTDEEKRKGYRRGTIETDILDENGKKRRVPFEMSPHDLSTANVTKKEDKFKELYDEKLSGEDEYTIHMSKQMLSRKPAISNFIFKHEEGHVAIHLDKSGKYVMEMDKIDKILTRLLHKMLTNKKDALNEHDMSLDEFLADKYAKEHSKYNKTSKYSLRDEGVDISTKEALKGLQSILTNDVYSKKIITKDYNSYVMPLAVDAMNQNYQKLSREYLDYRSILKGKIECLHTTERILTSFKGMLNKAEYHLKSSISDLKRYKADIERDHKHAYDLMKMYSDDLNNELIIARENGHTLSKSERRKKVDKMFYNIYMAALGSRPEVNEYIKYTIGSSDAKDYPEKLKKELDYYRNQVIFGKSNVQNMTNSVQEIQQQVDASTKNIAAMKKDLQQMSDELDKYYEMIKKKKSMYKSDEFQRCLDRVKLRHSHMISKSKLAIDDMSTAVRILMCLPKEERDRFAKEVHDAVIKFANIERTESMTQESVYEPLSEFDHYFQEAKMKAKTRKELDDSDFALVYKDASGNKIRKYPINDEAHVKAAARMFPRGVPNKYRKEVAGKILRRAHKFGIDTSGWKSLNAANEKD